MSTPQTIHLVGPNHPVATKLRRQHEQLVAALVSTRQQLMAYGVTPGRLHLAVEPEGVLVYQTDMSPPETPEVAWSAAGPHPTRTKQKARYESRKVALADPARPTREQILAAIHRALSGSATTLNTKAVHRFVLAELQTDPGVISLQTISKYLGKNPHLYTGRPNGSKLMHWFLASNSFVAGMSGTVTSPNPYPMR